MKVLVTGATGYVGHSIALTLAERGNSVRVLVRNPQSPNIPKHPLVEVFEGDVTDQDNVFKAVHGCDEVFHTAGLVRFRTNRATDFYDINVEGTRHMLEAALRARVQKFVFTSTAGVIGPSLGKKMKEDDPRTIGFDNDYELSKFLAEELVNEYSELGLYAVIASPTKVFGPGIDAGKLNVNSVIKRHISGKVSFCPVPDHLISNYVFINDLVNGHLLAAAKGRKGERYILGGEDISYRDFFEKLQAVSDLHGIILPVSKTISGMYGHWHFIQQRLMGKNPFFNSKAVSQVYCNKSFSSAKAIDELGYSITPFSDALQRTIHAFKIEMYGQQILYPYYRVQ